MWRIVNNWVHDTCTGLWAACVIVIYTLHVELAAGMPAEAADAIVLAQSRMWWLLVASLAGLAVTGGIRLRYWRSQASADELDAKRTALIWKHLGYVVVFGAGTFWLYTVAYSGT